VDEELDDAAGYYSIVLKPMDLSTVQTKLQKSFQDLARKRFLEDLDLIWSNAALYNGPTHPVTLQAEKLREIVVQLVTGICTSFVALLRLQNTISSTDAKLLNQKNQKQIPQ
jgi:bromodomain-containing factor 1